MFILRHMAAFGERLVNTLAIGKKKGVAYVEKNRFDLRIHTLCRTRYFQGRQRVIPRGKNRGMN